MVNATLERKTMREAIFEGLKWYVTASEILAPSKEEGEKERVKLSRDEKTGVRKSDTFLLITGSFQRG